MTEPRTVSRQDLALCPKEQQERFRVYEMAGLVRTIDREKADIEARR